jgi:hypothetical protein
MISVVDAMTNKDHKPGDDGKWPLHNEDERMFTIKMIEDSYLNVAELFDEYMRLAGLPQEFQDAYGSMVFASGFITSGKKVNKGNPQRFNWTAMNQLHDLTASRKWLKKQIKKLKKAEGSENA